LQLINVLSEFKLGGTRWLILRTNMGVAWLFNTSTSLALAVAAALVVGWAPAASGSGVPEVMAYLNGVLLPRVFNVYTIVGKFVSCGLAVASGLPVGPEGPMIHIGAALGAAISQGHSTTLRFTSNVFKRFRNPKVGASQGVAVGLCCQVWQGRPEGGVLCVRQCGGLLFASYLLAQLLLRWQHLSPAAMHTCMPYL
jgi:chloride channel 7